MNVLTVRGMGLVCLVVLVAGLASGLPATAKVVAESATLNGDGTSTLGTTPDLSVFSVMKFSGTLYDSSGGPRTGVVGLTFAFYSEQTAPTPGSSCGQWYNPRWQVKNPHQFSPTYHC